MKGQKLWNHTNRGLFWISMIMSLAGCAVLFLTSGEIHNFWNYYISNGLDGGGWENVWAQKSLLGMILDMSTVWYLIFLLGILGISICLFLDIKKEETKEWIFSLPISGEGIFLDHWIKGMIAYTAPLLVYGAGIFLIRWRNLSWIKEFYLLDIDWKNLLMAESPGNYIKILVIMWIWGTACYSIFFFFQTVCAKIMPSILTGIGVVMTPLYLSWIAQSLMAFIEPSGLPHIALTHIIKWEKYFICILNNGSIEEHSTIINNEIKSYFIRVDMNILALDMGIAILITVVCAVLSFVYFKKISDSCVEGIFKRNWIKIGVLAGLGLCIGSGIFTCLSFYQNMQSMGIVIPGSIMFAVIFAAVVSKLMKGRGY
jgi:hypothetical protein